MVKRLHLLVVKSYIGPLVLTFFIAEFVLIMHFLWLYIEDLVGKGLEWTIIAELLLYASAGLVKMALPLAILLASIMTFGNFGEHFELSAMKSSGISLQRIMLPLILFSVGLTVASFFWANNVIPVTNLKMGSLLYDVTHQRPEMNIKPGIFNRDIEGYVIKIKGKSQVSPMMYEFQIYDHTQQRGNPKVTLADSGYMQITDNQKYMIIVLYGGRTFEEMTEKNPSERLYPERNETFDKQTIIVELTGLDLERTDESLFKHHYQMKTVAELNFGKDSIADELEKRKVLFVNAMSKSKLFKYAPNPSPYTNPLDTAPKIEVNYTPLEEYKTGNHVNIDTIMSRQSFIEKDRTISIAIDDVKNSRSQIESNKLDLDDKERNINKHSIALHEKFTLSLACLIFFFIGAPLGAIIRKGGFGLPFLVSILFFIIYYIISIAGKKLVEESALPAWQGMWLSTFLTMPLGILFTYKATTDSVLFDIQAYIDFFKRPFKMLQIVYKDPNAVFHKSVEIPENHVLTDNIDELVKRIKESDVQIDRKLTSFWKLYLYYFHKDQSHISNLIQSYNSLFEILAVKYRERLFLKASLERFPRIDLEMYFINKKQRLFYYFFMTILFVPVGLFLVLLAYLKLKTLRQKTTIIRTQLLNFKGAPEHL
jgi:lipopolysaccharide export system permease protein